MTVGVENEYTLSYSSDMAYIPGDLSRETLLGLVARADARCDVCDTVGALSVYDNRLQYSYLCRECHNLGRFLWRCVCCRAAYSRTFVNIRGVMVNLCWRPECYEALSAKVSPLEIVDTIWTEERMKISRFFSLMGTVNCRGCGEYAAYCVRFGNILYPCCIGRECPSIIQQRFNETKRCCVCETTEGLRLSRNQRVPYVAVLSGIFPVLAYYCLYENNDPTIVKR
jgi:hypothetical protein